MRVPRLPDERGKAVSLTMFGLTLAILVGNPLSTWMGQTIGWRWAFAVPGLLTIGMGLLFMRLAPHEAEPPSRLRINPLAHWRREDIQEYMAENNLPRHPLVAKGYASIGCAPCTSPIKPGEDPRAGRWRGSQKTECGIHFIGGKMVRAGANT